MIDSAHVVLVDTINKHLVNANFFNTKTDDVFKDYLFPIVMLILGALITGITTFISDKLKDKKTKEKDKANEITKIKKSIHSLFITANIIDRIIAIDINPRFVLPNNAIEPMLTKIKEYIDNIEIEYKNTGYQFPMEIRKTISAYVEIINNFKRFAFEAMTFYSYGSGATGARIDAALERADKAKENALKEFEESRKILERIEKYLESN